MSDTKSIGAIWKRTGGKGEWLSISLDAGQISQILQSTPGDKINLVAFGGNKKSDKSPDFWIQPPREAAPTKDPEEVPF